MEFNLLNYQEEIEAIMSKNGCTHTAAVDRFICNLDTFNEYHRGTGTLNYHVLGHYWGNLTSGEKIAQKRAAKQRMTEKFSHTPKRTNARRTSISRRT